MAEAYYDLLITGIKDGENIEVIKERLASLYKTTANKFEFLAEISCLKKGIPIQKQLTHAKAESNKTALERCGLICSVEPSWQLVEIEKIYTCPACGYTQKLTSDESDICDQCGVIGKKYAETLKRKQELELEKRRYEVIKNNAEKVAREEKGRKLIEEEKKKIRRLFDWKEKSPAKLAFISSLLGLPIIGTIILAYTLWGSNTEESSSLITQTEPVPSVTEGMMQTASFSDKPTVHDANALKELARQEEKASTLSVAQQASNSPDEPTSAASEDPAQIGNFENFSQSLETAKGITDIKIRAETLSAIAADRAKAGDQKALKQTLSEIVETLKYAKDEAEKNSILQHSVEYYINNGNFDLALQFTTRINDPFLRVTSLNKIAQAHMWAENKIAAQQVLAQGVDLAKKINDPGDRAVALSSIAGLYAALGDKKAVQKMFALALDSAQHIIDPAAQATAMSTVAKEQAAAGYKEAAKQTFVQTLKVAIMEDGKTRADTLTKIAEDQASVNNFDEALETAGKIENAYLRAAILKDIGKMQVKAGQPVAANQTFVRALETSKYIDNLDERSKILHEVNNAQINAAKGW